MGWCLLEQEIFGQNVGRSDWWNNQSHQFSDCSTMDKPALTSTNRLGLHQAPTETKLSSNDYRKLKSLEDARKAGTEPAEVDEEGRNINPVQFLL